MADHLPTLPDWVPPLDTGQPNAGDLDDLSLLRKQTFAARNTIIPISYGRDRIFGQPCVVHVDEALGFLYVAYSFGQGEITGYETSFVDGVDVNDSQTGFLLNAGAAIELHKGEPSPSVSTLLSGVLTGYTDTLPDTAYIVLKVPQGSTRGFPRLEAILQGRRVYDPRLDSTQTTLTPPGSGAHRVGDPSTWVYSTNPAICFRDVIENFTGWDILDQGIVDLADYNDELIGGVKRREIGLTLNKPAKVEDWVKGFRTYMGAFLAWEGGKIRVIPNRADVEAQGAVILDGTASTYVDMGDQADLDFGATDDFTVECSFKVTSDNSLVVKKNSLGGVSVGYALYISSGNIVCRIADGTNTVTQTVTGTYDDDVFHTLAMSIDRTGDDMILTVDNVELTPTDISAVTLTLETTEEFRIGASGAGGELVTGLIDEVRVWNDIRTTQELSDNRLQEINDPTADSSLIGYWKLNEATSDTTAVDSSSNGNDGTLTGNAIFGVGYAQIIPDGVAMHIGVDDIVKDSLSLSRRSLRSVPNSVAIDYEDGSGAKWHTERVQADSPRVTSGDEARRLSRISLPGIHNASQAQREAIERLNWYLTDLEATVSLFDEGWQLQHGSIVAMTHPIGLDAKLFRVKRTTALSGRWVVDLVEYDPAVYSSEVVADPTTPDTNLGNPLSPPTIQNLSLVEELFTYKNGLTGSRVRATWTATLYPYLSQYLVEGYVDGTRVWQQFTQSNDVVTPPVEELVDDAEVTYEVRVYIQSPFAQGGVVTDTVQVEGKFKEPGDVPFINLTVITVDQVDITWGEAQDIDIWKYEVRIGDPLTNNTWALSAPLELVDGLTYSATGLAIGAHRFFVKARDSVGLESLMDIYADVTLNKPTAVLSVSGFEVASEVRLNWPAVVGGFVERYRVSYDVIGGGSEVTLDIVDTLRFQTKDVPEGTFEFSIWALDKNGIEADTAATIVIEVTSDADAFLADTYNFVSPSLTNVVSYTLRLDTRTFYVTNMGDSFAVTPTDFVAADPLANYHSVGASEWLSETKDFGLLLTGSWNLTHDATALQGNILVELELSAEDNASPSEPSFVKFTGAAKGIYRHARVRISTFNPPGTATSYVRTPLMNLKINVVPLEESGEDVSTFSAGIGRTIKLSREYTALKEIMVQPKNTIASGSAVTAVVDNIIIGPNTGIKFNGVNWIVGGDFAEVDPGTADFTVEFWAKNDSTGTLGLLVGKRNTSTSNGWEVLQTSSDEILFSIDDGSFDIDVTTTGDAFPDDGQWHHVSVRVDRSGNAIIRIDAVDEGTGSVSAASATIDNTSNFTFGARGGGTAIFSGEIDEVRIWSDLRTTSEIDDNRQVEVLASAAGLVGYWKCDGPVGTSVATSGGDVVDYVNGNDMDASGGTTVVFSDPGEAGNLIQKVNSFDVFIWDTFGQQVSEQFQWKWKAV